MKTEITPKRSQLRFDIASDLKKEFHVACKLNGTYMCDEIIRYVRAYVNRDKIVLDRLKERYTSAKDGE